MTTHAVDTSTADPTPADISAATAQRLAADLKAVIAGLTGGWSVWASDSGALYAARPNRLTEAELMTGLAQTVYGDTAAELVERLRKQMRIEAAAEATRRAEAS